MIKVDFKYNDPELEIIDILMKGNLIRFYLGKKESKWGYTNPDYKDSSGNTPEWLQPSDIYYGDDWDDAPYEHNAGPVYEEFIKGYIDIACGWDSTIIEPHCSVFNSVYSKEDFVNKKVPAIIILPKNYEIPESYYEPDELGNYKDKFTFFTELDDSRIVKIYFADKLKKLLDIAEREDL